MDAENSDVDSKYSLVLVTASMMAYVLFAGSAKAFGTLYAELLTYFEDGAGNTAWIGSISNFVISALGPVANHLCIVYTFRKVMFLGGILGSCGVLLTSFMPRIEWMYLTYGLLCGIGQGLQFSTYLTVVNYYVKKRRALASGFIVSGSGIGLFVLPHLYRILIEIYGLRGCFMVLSAINLHTCVAASLVRQPKSLIQKKRLKQDSNQHDYCKQGGLSVTTCDDTLLDNSQNVTCKTKPSRAFGFSFFDLSVFRIPSLAVVTVALFLHRIAFTGILTSLPAHVIALGYVKRDADLILSLSGIVDIMSKISFGVFADMISKQRRQHLLAVTIFLSGVSAVLVSFFDWYPVLIIYGLSVGTFTVAFLSLIPIVVIDIVGMERLPSTIGQIFFFLSLSMMIGPPVAGWLKDVTGSWLLSFRVVGSLSITGGILIILNPVFVKYFAQQDYHKPVAVKGTAEEKESYL